MSGQNVLFLRYCSGKLQLEVEVSILFLVEFGMNSQIVQAASEHFRFANALTWHQTHSIYFQLVKSSCHIRRCNQHMRLCHFSMLRDIFTGFMFEAYSNYGAKLISSSTQSVSCQR